jgi:1-acyl-sn-glycerol-3-phosphate acyltransferase
MIKLICYLIFKLLGFRFVTCVPSDLHSFVMIGAPHTSNWDFIPAMSVLRQSKLSGKFVIKNSWMRFPLNLILKPMGAIGLDRKALANQKTLSTTDRIADLFKQFPKLVLMISPEGTRSPNKEWKTGFYYIAKKAGVPIVLGYADFNKKEAGFGKIIYPTDFEADMKEIMQFYKNIAGKKPANFKLDHRYI